MEWVITEQMGVVKICLKKNYNIINLIYLP